MGLLDHEICSLPQGTYIPNKITPGSSYSVLHVAYSLYSDEEQGSPMLVHSFQQKLIAVGTKPLGKQMKGWEVSLIRSCLLYLVVSGMGLGTRYISALI